MTKTILKVIVGSQAHGLATPESDFDYRGVFVCPTKEILSLGAQPKNTHWVEGQIDDTQWEIGHFLHLATKCNPTILETFLSPVEDVDMLGAKLRGMFQYVWNSTDVMNAFIGYGHNQRKKMLENKDGNKRKFAAAYARTLYNAWELLTTGTFTIKIADTPVGSTVRRFKEGHFELGEVIDFCAKWEEKIREAYETQPKKETDMDKVNEFLLEVRQANW